MLACSISGRVNTKSYPQTSSKLVGVRYVLDIVLRESVNL